MKPKIGTAPAHFSAGDRVIVTTENNATNAPMTGERRAPKVETWRGRVVCRSPFGTDWYIVRPVGSKTGGASTVPIREMQPDTSRDKQ